MSRSSAALEAAVVELQLLRAEARDRPGPRQRLAIDRAYAATLRLLAPRIRHFARQYGLVAHREDAEQCCAIALHRALDAYDPAKAQFTTFINWQIRGELQALRFRLMIDSREPAKKVGATTVSLHALARTVDGEEVALESALVDEAAEGAAAAGAAAFLADKATRALLAAWRDAEARSGADPARRRRDRSIAAERLFDLPGETRDAGAAMTTERQRQIGRRGALALTRIVRQDPRFRIMAGELRIADRLPQRVAG